MNALSRVITKQSPLQENFIANACLQTSLRGPNSVQPCNLVASS